MSTICIGNPNLKHTVESRFFEPPGEKEIGLDYLGVSKMAVKLQSLTGKGKPVFRNRELEKSGFYFMLLQRGFVRLSIPTSPSPTPPPPTGIAQSDKIHSLTMQFSLFRLLLKHRNTKNTFP